MRNFVLIILSAMISTPLLASNLKSTCFERMKRNFSMHTTDANYVCNHPNRECMERLVGENFLHPFDANYICVTPKLISSCMERKVLKEGRHVFDAAIDCSKYDQQSSE